MKPIPQALDTANRLAAGEMHVNIAATTRDETGQMPAALKNMADQLTRIISEVRSSVDSIASASEEASATAQTISQAASEEQSNGVTQVNGAVGQLNQATKQTASSPALMRNGQPLGTTLGPSVQDSAIGAFSARSDPGPRPNAAQHD